MFCLVWPAASFLLLHLAVYSGCNLDWVVDQSVFCRLSICNWWSVCARVTAFILKTVWLIFSFDWFKRWIFLFHVQGDKCFLMVGLNDYLSQPWSTSLWLHDCAGVTLEIPSPFIIPYICVIEQFVHVFCAECSFDI